MFAIAKNFKKHVMNFKLVCGTQNCNFVRGILKTEKWKSAN